MLFFENECFVCKSTDFLQPCNRCYLISYCGSAHEVKNWPMHKDFCNVIWSIMREQRVSHIYEKLCGVDLDTWIKERKQMCLRVRYKLKRSLFFQEEQMLLLPRSCFVCYNTKQDLLTTCPVCLCANFCIEHPSSSQHDKDCLSLKLFHEFNGKMHDLSKLESILTLINEIAETTKFYNSSDIPQSMVEYLNQQIKGTNHMFQQVCASNLLTMSLTLFSALKKLNLQSTSKILVHVRCDVSDSSIWELLLHFLPNLTALHIVFIEQKNTQRLKVNLCDDCCSKNKKMTLETNELLYKNYVKSKIYKKPDIFAYLNTEISKNSDENLEWDFLLENLSRIGSPLVLTSVTEKMAKMVSESLRSTFWPSLICYEGPNDFGALDPLREWTDGGISKINQQLIVTLGRTIQCKANTFYSSSFLSKKRRENSRSPLMFFYSHLCQVCQSNDISIYCKFCSMIFYCSESHRQEDWCKHKDICHVIQRLLKKSGMRNIFDGEIDLMGGQKTDPESWLRAKLILLTKAESEFGKKLWVFQQQMILFPRTCFVCHESDVNKLKSCECGINLCKKHNGSPIHKEMCQDFQLSWQLFEQEKLSDPLPKSKYISGLKEKLPATMEEFMDLHLTLENKSTAEENPHFNRIVIAELLTKPLTLLYAIKKLMIPEFKNDNDSENNSTIVVHIIGSKNSENAYFECWDIFFNWIPNLKTLNITYVGPETITLNLNSTYHESKERNLSIKSYPVDYEQFVQSRFFVKPDIIVGYNLDIHECDNDKCSCKENILNIQKLNVPFVMTSGTKERTQKDHERLSKVLERSIKYDICDLNPFASLVPERDFETEGLRYSNKYLLIYCELDQTPDAFQNSKLRKLLLERQEAEKLADTSHLSDFEKALRNLKIESVPISSTENAESNTKAFKPKNSFLFEAAQYELKYMLRNVKGTSKSVNCTNSESKTDPKSKSELCSDKIKTCEKNFLFSTQPSEHKSESGSVDEDLQLSKEKSLKLDLTGDSEPKSEFGSAKYEVLEDSVSPSIEDSKCLSENGHAKQLLFKENLLFTTEDSEEVPESGSKHIWNEIFNENTLAVSEDSAPELESGYAKVEICKENLYSEIINSDCKSKSGSAKEEISEKNLSTSTSESLKFKDFSIEDSRPKLEIGSAHLETFLITESSKLESEFDEDDISKAEEGHEAKSEAEISDGGTSMKNLWLSSDDSESESESDKNKISVDFASDVEPESEDMENNFKKNVLSTVEQGLELKSETKLTNGESLIQDVLLLTENSESKLAKDEISKKNLSEIVNGETSMEILCPVTEDYKSGLNEDKISVDSSSNLESESEISNEKLLAEDVLPIAENSELITESEESKLIESTDAVSKSESAFANLETLKEDSEATTEDAESKSESGFIKSETLIEETLKEDLSLTTEEAKFKSEPGFTKSKILMEDLLLITKDFNSKSEPATLHGKLLKENLLSSTMDSESKCEEYESTKNEIFRENLLSMTEDSENKLEYGSSDDLMKEDLLLNLVTIKHLECDTDTGAYNDKLFNKDLLTTNGDLECKSKSEIITGETLNENSLLITEDFEFKSANVIILKEDLFITAENSECKSKSVSDSTSTLNSEPANVERLVIADFEYKSESEIVNEEALIENLLTKFDDSEPKLKSRSADSERLIVTAEDSENKLEFGSADNLITERLLIQSSVTEDSECLSEIERVNEIETECADANDEILNENSLTNIENSESKIEFASEVSKPKVESKSAEDFGRENVLLISSFIENSEYKVETALFNDGVFQENLFITESLESRSESGSSIVETLKEESSQKNLLLLTNENSETKSDPGFDKDEILKEISLSTTEDSECKSESGPTNEELLRENLLLKEEIIRLTENEELIKSENSFLKKEICRLREEKTSI